jgi:PAS domain S-box-containing protein
VSEIGGFELVEGSDENELLNLVGYLKSQIARQREAEKKVLDQKQFYESILNRLPADIAVLDADRKYLYVNPVGIKDNEIRSWIIGKNDVEYAAYRQKDPSFLAGRTKMIEDTIAARTEREWEERSVGNDGTITHHLRKLYPVFDPAGELEMVICYGINITERKLIEEQIRQGEARYKAIFDNSLALICTHDLSGVLLDLNKASVDAFEYPREELLGLPLQHLIPPEKKADFEHDYLDVIRATGKAEGIMVALNKQGKKIYLLYHNYLVANEGEQPYVIGFSQDITARFDAERALKRSEEKYRNIIANMNLGLLEVDAREHIVYANNSFCEMSGYALEELVGRSASQMFWNDEHSVLNHDVIKRRQDGDSDAYELKTRNKKGDQKWWLISGAPTFDTKGKFIGSIGIHLDITLQKTLENQLRTAKSDAELSAQAKEVFLANISHEIRTPMNAILGIGRLLGKTHLGAQQKFYLNTINNAANNLLVIINDLLDFSKIEAGKLALEHIGFDLNATISNAIQILNHKAEEKGLLLHMDYGQGIAPVLIGDPYRLNQVLMNFLSNSLKFTEKGEVLIGCAVKSEDRNNQVIEFRVVDTGIGMSEEFLANLFDKFSQEDESVTRKFGGTGLGMSISKQLIELMGGAIKVRSEKNHGTAISFSITFEKGTAEDLEDKKLNAIDTQVLKGKRLLLVEDNDMNRLLANTILSQYGAEVTEAGNGQVAIEMLRENTYDLVLMDVQMPVKDGIEATKYIRANIDAGIPIIALTANAYKKEEDRCLQAGMNDFISKPFEESRIVQVVAGWLGKLNRPPVVPKAAAGEDAAAEKLYDLEKIAAVSRGNAEFAKKMVSVFIETMPGLIAELGEVVQQGDWKKATTIIQQVRSSALTMNITSLCNDFDAFEDIKSKGIDRPKLQSHAAHITSVITEVVRQMKAGQ